MAYNSSLRQQYNTSKEKAAEIQVYEKSVTFTFFDFPLWAFELYTVPDLRSIIGVCEDCEEFALPYQIPRLYVRIREHGFLNFITGLELTMSKALYSQSVSKWPVKATFSIANSTGPFKTYELALTTYSTNMPLLTYRVGSALVDPATHKPATSIPDWYEELMNEKQTNSSGLKVQRLKRPAQTFQRKCLILCSDLDQNNHANYRTYVNKCYNTLCEAVTLKKYSRRPGSSTNGTDDILPKWITADIVGQGTKSLRVRYLNESLPGEKVTVHLWQEEGKPFWVFLSMERGKSEASQDVIFEMSLEYFNPSPNL